jgi:pimeloyl-ACP methyl ester carboxylesterase
MATLIPASKLLVVEGAGHLPTLERPDEANTTLRDWLLDPARPGEG